MRHLAAVAVTVLLVGCSPAGRAATLAPALCGVALQPLEAPAEAIALIEIPRGGTTKYEFDLGSGKLVADRELPDSLGYPAAYGTFPCTLAGDGDPLDVLVLTSEPLDTASLIRVRPIGVLEMLDRGAPDAKVVAVPIASPLQSVPLEDRQAIAHFFAIYKGPGADTQLGAWLDARAALELLRDAIAAATRQ